jgi:hypothetical protein
MNYKSLIKSSYLYAINGSFMDSTSSSDLQRRRDEPTREIIREGLLLRDSLGRLTAFRFMTDHGVPPVIANRALLQ